VHLNPACWNASSKPALDVKGRATMTHRDPSDEPSDASDTPVCTRCNIQMKQLPDHEDPCVIPYECPKCGRRISVEEGRGSTPRGGGLR
jgi:hypothetical protein